MKPRGMNIINDLLFLFNFLFVFTGIIIIAVGATIQAIYYDYEQFLEGKFFTAPVLLISVGLLVFVVTFFGCCGVMRESTCMVMTFAFLLSLIFLLELAAGIAGYLLMYDLQSVLKSHMYEAMENSNQDRKYKDAWDLMQRGFRCCGVRGPNDWSDRNFRIPSSCCDGSQCFYFEIGCLPRLQSVIQNSALTIGGIATVFGLVQFFCVIFACFLGRTIRKQKQERLMRWEDLREISATVTNLGSTDSKYAFGLYMEDKGKCY